MVLAFVTDVSAAATTGEGDTWKDKTSVDMLKLSSMCWSQEQNSMHLFGGRDASSGERVADPEAGGGCEVALAMEARLP